MQLKIYMDAKENPLTLPLNYFHILQGILYHALQEDKKFTRNLHNYGLTEFGNYKFFCFGCLCGKHFIQDQKITFTDKIFWEVRSINGYLLSLIYAYFLENRDSIWSANLSSTTSSCRKSDSTR